MRKKPLLITLIVTGVIVLIAVLVSVLIYDIGLTREAYERCLVENGYYEADDAGRDVAQIACTGFLDDVEPS